MPYEELTDREYVTRVLQRRAHEKHKAATGAVRRKNNPELILRLIQDSERATRLANRLKAGGAL